jgi:hypothetical protein
MIRRVIQVSAAGFLLALSACSSKADDDSGAGATGGTASTTGGTGGTSPGPTGGTGTGGTGAVAGMASGGTSGGSGMSNGGGGTSSGGASGMPGATCGTMLKTGTADNYKFHSELSVDVTKVQPSTELHFDWSGVKKDLLGHDVDLSQISMVEIGLWNLTLDQFEKKLNDDTLAQHDLAIIATIIPATPGATTGSIYDLTEMGSKLTKADIDPYLDINMFPPVNHIYTAMVANGDVYGKGTRMLTGFQLDAASTNTQVNVTSDSTKLSLTADLHTLTPLTVPAGTPGITFDWTDLMTSAANLEIDPTQITKIRVGKYSISATDMEQQNNFLNLDALADTLYTATVAAGTSYDLSKTKDANMNTFPGIDDTHTWIVALNCGDCANPAPWYMTILKPCAK